MATSTLGSKSNAASLRGKDKIIDIFSKKTIAEREKEQFVRLSPEYDGLSILYSNSHSSNYKLFTMKILCWGIRLNGEIVGLIPWLNKLMPCTDLQDPDYGYFEAYYDVATNDTFAEPPPYKTIELNAASLFFSKIQKNKADILQEIPDNIGTHAMLYSAGSTNIILTEVLSWQLLGDGTLRAMLIDELKVKDTPVLPGDSCLYPADQNPSFRYFFQHHIANQIKDEDPDAMAAISLLLD